MTAIVKSIQLERESYGDNKGQMRGKVNLTDGYDNHVQIKLSEEQCQQVLELVADSMVATINDVAKDMTARVFSAKVPVLEAPSE